MAFYTFGGSDLKSVPRFQNLGSVLSSSLDMAPSDESSAYWLLSLDNCCNAYYAFKYSSFCLLFILLGVKLAIFICYINLDCYFFIISYFNIKSSLFLSDLWSAFPKKWLNASPLYASSFYFLASSLSSFLCCFLASFTLDVSDDTSPSSSTGGVAYALIMRAAPFPSVGLFNPGDFDPRPGEPRVTGDLPAVGELLVGV